MGNQTRNLKTVSRSLIQIHGQSNTNLENSLTQLHTNIWTIKRETIQSHAASYKHTGNQTRNKTVSRSRSVIQSHGQSNTKQDSLTQPHAITRAIRHNLKRNSLTQPHTNTRTIKHEAKQSAHAASYKHAGIQTQNNTVSRSLIQTYGQSNRIQSHAASYKHTGNQT